MFQLARHEEKLSLQEASLASTQEQLSARVSEVVRHEQTNRRLTTEVRTLTERTACNEEELVQQRVMIDKLRKDVLASKQETHNAVQEGMSYKQQASKFEVELEGAREQERMLLEQVGGGNQYEVCCIDRCCQTSNIRYRLVGNKVVDHSDVVGASPGGAAPTTSSFST